MAQMLNFWVVSLGRLSISSIDRFLLGTFKHYFHGWLMLMITCIYHCISAINS